MLPSQPLSWAVIWTQVQVLPFCWILPWDETAYVSTMMLQTLFKLLIDHICVLLTFWLPITWQITGMQQIHVQLINENHVIQGGYHLRLDQTNVMSKERRAIWIRGLSAQILSGSLKAALAHQLCFIMCSWVESGMEGKDECSQWELYIMKLLQKLFPVKDASSGNRHAETYFIDGIARTWWKIRFES